MQKLFFIFLSAIIIVCGIIICSNALAVSLQPGDSAGVVHLFKSTSSSTDPYTNNPSADQQQWISSHYMGMLVYSPYWDSKLSWYSQAYAYKDAYAIYTSDSATIASHPEWILKDTNGNNLYINWNCKGGTCPQYAADISNPDYRQAWTNAIAPVLAKGYRGLFIDDVNMDWRISDGNGNSLCNDGNNAGACPTVMDPNTGAPMKLEDWRMYFAQFLQQIRGAFPNAAIIHNSIWYAGGPNGLSDPYIQQQILGANMQYIEHGVTDAGVTGDGGQYSLQAMQNRIDTIHSLGRSVILGASGSVTSDEEYTTANYFLTSNGYDAVGSSGASNFWDTYWTGFDTNFGTPAGDRYVWNGLIRRDFTGGIVLVNPPGSAAQTLTLPAVFQRTDGSQVSSLILTAGQGALLAAVGDNSTPPPVVAPDPLTGPKSPRRFAPNSRLQAPGSVR